MSEYDVETAVKSHWDTPVYLQCDCHTPYHAVVLEEDEDIPGTVNVSVMSAKHASFWHRLKYGMRHIFGAQSLVEADVILNEAAVSRLADFCATVRAKTITSTPPTTT